MISCEKLAAGYGKKTVLSDISWKSPEGKLTVIVGPNGSGKSTLLKALTGQTVAKSGSVYLDGKPLAQWSGREVARRVAYLPQSRNDTNISVFRMALHGRFPYLSYPRHYTDKDEEMVVRAAERMGIRGLLEKTVSKLSGGEKQRAFLTMALVQDAPILLLDEPATYLDISAQLELMELLAQLTREDKTVIAVLHDLNQALRFADELVLLANGELKQCGTPEELRKAGVLEEVFHVRIHVFRDERGVEHYCFSNCPRTPNTQRFL